MSTLDDPSLHPLFSQGPFLHRFCPSEKAKKKDHSWISEENLAKTSDFDFLCGSFLYKKRVIFANFSLYIQIFYVLISETLNIWNFI